MDYPDEVWKPIARSDGHHEISSLGRVRRLKSEHGNAHVGRVLRPNVKPDGYLMTALYVRGNKMEVPTHVLVAEAFLGPKPIGKEVNHIDGNRSNPSIENLEYVTRSENHLHSAINFGSNTGEKHYKAKLKRPDVDRIRELHDAGVAPKEIAAEFPQVSYFTVWNVLAGRSWKHDEPRTPKAEQRVDPRLVHDCVTR